MASTNFVNGTVIEAEWLNDVNDFVYNNYSSVANVKDDLYGAFGDNVADDTAAIQAAISSGAKVIYFPTGIYRISDTLVTTVPIKIKGDGAKFSIIRQTDATKGGIAFDFPSLVQGGGIEGISFEAGAGWLSSGFTGSGSIGVGIYVNRSNGLFYANDFSVANFDYGVQTDGCWYAMFTDFQIFFFTTRGIEIGPSGAAVAGGTTWSNGKISNNGFTGTNNGVGINITASGGEYFYTIDVTSASYGAILSPETGFNVLYCFFDMVLTDTCINDGWTFDGTNGKCWSHSLVNCWSSYHTKNGVVVQGAQVDSVRWVGGRIRENGEIGVWLKAGVNIDFDTCEISGNSRLSSTTYPGVGIDAGVSEWGLTNNRIGNVAVTSNTQGDSIFVAAGASGNFRIIGNDLRGFGAGKLPLQNGSTVLNYIVSRNLPLQTVGTNFSDRQDRSTTSVTTIAAATTAYMGPAGAFAGANASLFVLTQAGLCSGFYAAVEAPPGAGQSFTYTVFRNGIATPMTGTISDGNFSVLVTSNGFTTNPTDTLNIRVVTSAGAAVTTHRATITVEP